MDFPPRFPEMSNSTSPQQSWGFPLKMKFDFAFEDTRFAWILKGISRPMASLPDAPGSRQDSPSQTRKARR